MAESLTGALAVSGAVAAAEAEVLPELLLNMPRSD